MKKFMNRNSFVVSFPAYLVFFTLLILVAGCRKADVKKLKNFEQVNLVANNGNYGAPNIDPLQINSWGLAWAPSGIAWVNSQGGHVSALYNAEGVPPRVPVNIPGPGGPATGNPTGIVFNGSADFVLSNGTPARFMFVNLDGILSGWNGGNNALVIIDNSATSVYTGMAIGVSNSAIYIYASDFANGKIDVWDKSFNPVSMPFTDPWLPQGYSPFNIQAVGEWLYVMYAKVGPDGRDEKGIGKGVVSIFKTDGSFVKRFATRDLLNAPWGVTKAHKDFFQDPDDDANVNSDSGHKNDHHRDTTFILVGNFGDGKINVYTTRGEFIGQLRSHGHTIVIDGLWAIGFPPATATTIDPNRLYFTAGPAGELDGLFGYLIKK